MASCKEKVDSDTSLNSVAAATMCEFYFQETLSLASVIWQKKRISNSNIHLRFEILWLIQCSLNSALTVEKCDPWSPRRHISASLVPNLSDHQKQFFWRVEECLILWIPQWTSACQLQSSQPDRGCTLALSTMPGWSFGDGNLQESTVWHLGNQCPAECQC